MEKDNCLVKVEGEDGKTFDMLILKEFDYKNKKYAVLSEIDACNCNDDCECDEECHCGCDCGEDCDCGCQEGKECTCGGECHCGCNHECDGECHCEDEPMLCLLEIIKDKDGNEVFKSIDDEKLFDELVEEADKILYED